MNPKRGRVATLSLSLLLLGTPAAMAQEDAAIELVPVDVAVFDINNDGYPDMVFGRCNGTYVWKVALGARVEKVPVVIGLRQKGRVQVIAGITPGDRVISAGTNKVLAGDLVEAVEER